jgi:hypothetical protein
VSAVPALWLNAMPDMKVVHRIELRTQAARRHDDVNVVPKFLLGSRCSEVTVTGRERLIMHAPMSAFAVAIGGKADMPFCTAYVGF